MLLHPSVPARTVKELIDYAKIHPGNLNFGSSGPGSSPHLFAELFMSMAGVQMTHVPYKGVAQYTTAMLSSEVQFAFASLFATKAYWETGRLRLIAQSGSKRLEAMPDVPTVAESGVPGYEASSWWGYMAPARTPQAIIDRLYEEIAAVANLPEVRQMFIPQGSEIVANKPTEFAKIVQSDAENWGAIGRRLGIKLD
jgi:tripartite-type tricarboxylate transporter receptor subunit TctC